MIIVVYIMVFIVVLAGIYLLLKILGDGKKALLKRMLDSNDISRDTYLKYLEKL